MPSPEAILAEATAIANEWQSVAIIWHIVLAIAVVALGVGWQPPTRWLALTLAAPFISVSAVAWMFSNPFNGTAFAVFGVLLIVVARRFSSIRFERASPLFSAAGVLLVVFGWMYPHFLRADSWTAYAYASPFGLLPCPTLSVVIGLTLIFGLTRERAWGAALAVAATIYGVIGVFQLGVSFDYGLLAGAAVLLFALRREPVVWRSVRAFAGERARALPGDDLIKQPLGTLTHAITIRGASARDVWPWLVQMGAGSRAGWYSYDSLDNAGRHSARHVVAELQQITVGMILPALPGVTDGFAVISFRPDHSLVLGWPAQDGTWAVTWAFELVPLGACATRLVVRARAASGYSFYGLPPGVSLHVVRVVHFVMQRRQLLGIAGRIEGMIRAQADTLRDALLDQFMPVYDIVERHHIRVEAPVAVTFAAARDQDLLRSPGIRAIFRARELLLRSTPDESARPRRLVEQMKGLGWGVLAEIPGREIIMGAVTEPWESDVTFRTLAPDAFATYDEPGHVKIAWTLRADPHGTSASDFRTETRAVATDAAARTRFQRYWALVSPGVALIRWLSLRPLKQEAERLAHRQAAA